MAAPTTSDDAVVLDIGDGIGALILSTTEAVLGAEIEVSPMTDGARRTHTRIRRHRVNGNEVFAGVYPGLAAGTWRVYGVDDCALATVEIRSGEVSTVDGGECRSVASD